jgi:subtilisin family serine protease
MHFRREGRTDGLSYGRVETEESTNRSGEPRLPAVVALAGFLVASSLALTAHATPSDRHIVRIKPNLNGLSVIQQVCQIVGCSAVRTLDASPNGSPLTQGSLFLVTSALPLDASAFLTPLLQLVGVAAAEPDLLVALREAASPEGPTADLQSPSVTDYLWRRTPQSYYGSSAWEGYLQQPAVSIVRLRDAQCAFSTSGVGLVAIVDTGIDASHPAFGGVVKWGYDFTRDSAGGDEKADVEQESAALLDGTDVYQVNQESAALLDQESAALLDNPDYVAFGHGTMVAGVVHLVAPTAEIMPLKAFRADGSGYLSDILRALYYAIQKNADVINMSFSRPTQSAELKRVIDQAALGGAVAVSSAGNEGLQTLRWPAALDNVVGVASTSNQDARSSFSNYGNDLVWLAAPGEGVVTTYPWGTYAAAWGTSFSTPFAAGTAALFVGLNSPISQAQAAAALAQAEPVSGGLGWGRLDVFRAVPAGLLLWPNPAPVTSGGPCQLPPP